MFNEYYQLSYTDIQENLRQQTKTKGLPLHVTVLRNVMLEPIETYWRFLAKSLGFNAEIHFGGYDQVFAEAVGGLPEFLNAQTEVVFIFLYLEVLSPSLSRRFAALNKEQIHIECDRIDVFCRSVLSGIRRQTSAIILWHSFELPVYPAMGIMENVLGRQQVDTIRQLNVRIQDALNDVENAYCVDLDLCRARVGARGFYDQRYWHIGHAPYSREAYREIAYEDFKYIRALKSKNKKCLVVDCDNTLWGGVIGEDGLSKISLSTTYPGSTYYEFQQEIVNLYDRGVIIALCSKNNANDVWEVFRSHPDMVLKERHIAVAQINWDDKATNIRRIADALNIGIDSIVFVDDSEFELGLIRQALPEVEVLSLAGKSPVEYRLILAGCGLFDVLGITDEDRNRGRMYKDDVQRKQLAEQIVDMSTYLRSLEMVASVRLADEFAVARVSQLSQRTNQFNLTTCRYTEDDIRVFLKNKMMAVFILELKDRFGDMGIVAVCILCFEVDYAEIDTFFLSCRAFGRKAEKVLLAKALQSVKDKGIKQVKAKYLSTAKNGIAQDFYEQHGFRMISNDITGKKYEFDLLDLDSSMPVEYAQIMIA